MDFQRFVRNAGVSAETPDHFSLGSSFGTQAMVDGQRPNLITGPVRHHQQRNGIAATRDRHAD